MGAAQRLPPGSNWLNCVWIGVAADRCAVDGCLPSQRGGKKNWTRCQVSTFRQQQIESQRGNGHHSCCCQAQAANDNEGATASHCVPATWRGTGCHNDWVIGGSARAPHHGRHYKEIGASGVTQKGCKPSPWPISGGDVDAADSGCRARATNRSGGS